ncbi:putative F-box/LRR-repeat protein 23 [Andrographis paniculata]|uniref:putative F-box/LRR-repeat protein 23 n=1 Tax=Andrographis paniculata TaxID=175694 RepID=UPI0021E85D5B|nr:putative F-box/LRR-repeat protein 23 [Andrographis paniculata]
MHRRLRKKKTKIRRRKRKSQAMNPSPLSPPWVDLPSDVTANILQRLDVVEILQTAQKVCTTWWKVCKDPSMWKVIDMRDSLPDFNIEIMCREAVDRSQGQLTDINIGYFGTDELILYISERCSGLKSLTLKLCCDVSSYALREAVRNFPKLEELHLLFHCIGAEDVENIGTSCPQLKSFTLNAAGTNYPGLGHDDSWALAVSKSMLNLHHLCLLGHNMTSEGLEAILDGCPHLQSLDIRRCFSIDLNKGNLGKRCSERIKDLKFPHDAIDDCNKIASEFVHCYNYYDSEFSNYSDSDLFGNYEDYSEGDYEDYTDLFADDFLASFLPGGHQYI